MSRVLKSSCGLSAREGVARGVVYDDSDEVRIRVFKNGISLSAFFLWKITGIAGARGSI